MVVYVVFDETSSQGCPADGDEPGGSIVQSMGSVNYNRSNTSSMATSATFSKTKACEAFSMRGGCDMVLRMADTATISSGPLFISRDGCTVVAYCHF